MKKCRAVTLTAVLLILLFSFSGCGALDLIKGMMGGFDAKGYVQGTLDCIYKGQYSAAYLKTTDMTKQDAEQMHLDEMDGESQYFADYFAIEIVTDSTKAKIIDLLSDIYSHAKYDVIKVEKKSDGNFLVDLSVQPMDVIKQLNEKEQESFMTEFNNRTDAGEFDAMTDEQYEDEWAAGIIGLFDTYKNKIGYDKAQTIQIRVEKNPDDGLYYINSEDYDTIDNLVLYYPS